MPTFHFNFRRGAEKVADEHGLDFNNVEEAYLSAFDGASDMWRELLKERTDPRTCSFIVTDSIGRTMFELPFGEVLDACGPPARKTNSTPSQSFGDVIANAQRAQRSFGELRREISAARKILNETRALIGQAEQLGIETRALVV